MGAAALPVGQYVSKSTCVCVCVHMWYLTTCLNLKYIPIIWYNSDMYGKQGESTELQDISLKVN